MSSATLPRSNPYVLLAILGLVLIAKIPTLGTPPYWDEVRYVQQAHWLSRHDLIQVLPGLRPPAVFFGHPPGLHATLAVLWKLSGPSIAVAHLLIACFAAAGICGTFLLGRMLYGTKTGLFAALLLLVSPLYFAQSGMFLADVPVAALGVLSVYLALRERYLAYLLCASYMVLLKETAIALVVALIIYRFFVSASPVRQRIIDTLRHSVPLFVIGAFLVLQRATTGKFFFIYNFDIQMFKLTGDVVRDRAETITRWIFVEQHRYIFTAAIALNLVVSPAARRRRELWLFALVALLSGYSFAVLYFLPRYLLPVLPFFYVLGAVSVMDLIRSPRGQWAIGGAVVVLTTWWLFREPFRGNGEFNLTYLRVVNVQRQIAREIAITYPASRVLTTSRLFSQLREPLLGYVDAPLHARIYGGEQDFDQTDVVLVSRPATDNSEALRAVVHRKQWKLVRRLGEGGIDVELYTANVK